MNHKEREPKENGDCPSAAHAAYEEWVVAFDEALRRGNGLPDETAEFSNLDATFRERLESAKNCLQLIERVRQFRKGNWTQLSPSGSGLPRGDTAYSVGGGIQRIGRFEIARELGRGSHGIVFLARDPGLNRQIALKVPRPEAILTPQLRSRFLREGKAAARLNHRNILPVHEAGEAGPICYLVQSYCTGPSLAAWLAQEKEPVPCELAARLAAELADGVDHAHKQGVLHRDIKPANVLLEPHLAGEGLKGTRDDRTGNRSDRRFPFTPRLTDFGLAKSLDDDPNSTMTLGTVGTASYMPPEQATGQLSLVGPRSDVYSLGALLYELLTRRPPITGTNQLETLRLIATAEPNSIRQLRPDVPGELEAICLKCLEKSPGHRYQSAAEFAADLRRFLNGESVTVSPQGRLRRTIRRLRRQPLSVLIGAGAIGLLTMGLLLSILVIWTNRRASIGGSGSATSAVNAEAVYLDGIERVSQGYFDAIANRGDIKTAVRELDAFLERHRPQPGQADYRGFEWHHLWRLCHPDKVAKPFPKLFDLVGHKGEIYHVTFSPDGRRIATACQDHTGRIWDARSGTLIATLVGHTDDVNWIAFSPESLGSHVVTASDDESVRIWDCESGKAEGVLSCGGRKAIAVQIASILDSEGTQQTRRPVVVAGDDRGRLLLWDWTTRHQLRTIQAHGARVESMAPLILRRNWWVTASLDHTAKEWDGDTWTPVRTHVADAAISAVSCNSDVSLMAFTSVRATREDNGNAPRDEFGHPLDGLITLDDLHTGKRWLTLTGPSRCPFQSVRFYPNQLALVATSRERIAGGTESHVLYWDVPTQRCWKPFSGSHPDSWCAAFSDDGTRIATAGDDGIVRVWDSSVLPGGTTLNGSKSAVAFPARSAAYSADGRKLLVNHSAWPQLTHGQSFVVWDVTGERPIPIHSERTENKEFASFAGCFSPDGRLIAVDGSRWAGGKFWSSIRLLDAESLREIKRFDGYAGAALRILFTPDAKRLVAVTGVPAFDWIGEQTSLHVWQVDESTAATTLLQSGSRGALMATAISPDGNLLATNRERVELYEFPSLKLKQRLPFATPVRCAIQFSPDGGVLAVSRDDGAVHLWDVTDGKERASLRSDGHGIASLAFSPDGTRLAVGLVGAPQVDLWHVPTGRRLGYLPMPADVGLIAALSFAPDQQSLAATGVGVANGRASCVFLFPLSSVDDARTKR